MWLKTKLAGVSVAVLQSLVLFVFCITTKNYVGAWTAFVAVVLAYQPALKDLLDQISPYAPGWLEKLASLAAIIPALLMKLVKVDDRPPAPPPPLPPPSPSPKPGDDFPKTVS